MLGHPRRRPAGRTALLAIIALAVAACASEASDAPDATDDTDVTTACDRVEDLANAVLQARDATSRDQFAAAIEGPQRAFLQAAEASGDDRLAELARTYGEQLAAWRVLPGADADEAGQNADIALDRAGARCIALGAHNDFPEEPG
ncbi:MAG TPA: hypothetical protein VKB57_09645 [Acidimicrobiales bacterium]|nr:hypothetical protein [Acidimicrobiales bacterium]